MSSRLNIPTRVNQKQELSLSRLTFNDAKSFKAILNYTINEIDSEITSLRAQNTRPFLQ